MVTYAPMIHAILSRDVSILTMALLVMMEMHAPRLIHVLVDRVWEVLHWFVTMVTNAPGTNVSLPLVVIIPRMIPCLVMISTNATSMINVLLVYVLARVDPIATMASNVRWTRVNRLFANYASNSFKCE